MINIGEPKFKFPKMTVLVKHLTNKISKCKYVSVIRPSKLFSRYNLNDSIHERSQKSTGEGLRKMFREGGIKKLL